MMGFDRCQKRIQPWRERGLLLGVVEGVRGNAVLTYHSQKGDPTSNSASSVLVSGSLGQGRPRRGFGTEAPSQNMRSAGHQR